MDQHVLAWEKQDTQETQQRLGQRGSTRWIFDKDMPSSGQQ